MGASAVVLTCTCGGKYRADNQPDAWAQLQNHIQEMAGIDDALHAYDGETAEPLSPGLTLSAAEEAATRRDDLTAQMHRRNFDGPWSDAEEAAFLLDLLRWMALSTHDAYHQTEPQDWRQCRRSTCTYAALALPENKGGISVD